MKRLPFFRISIALLFLVLPLLSQTDEGKTLLLSHKLVTTDGNSVSLEQLKGPKGMVLIFWSNTCPWVAKYEARTIEIIKQYKEKGFGFVLINSNDPRKYKEENLDYMKKKADEKKYGCLYVKDRGSKLASALGATRTPHVFIFDANNKLVYKGAIDDNAENPQKVKNKYVKLALDKLASGQALAYKETKAIGCTIKWYKQIEN
ncbi:MAG: thioredoxin family protein [Calditrichia bacterium]